MRRLAAICLLLSGCAGSPQWESAVRHKEQTPGRHIQGGCAVFARELQKRMAKDGVPTKLVTFTVTITDPPASVLHQIVAYQVGEESWFIGNDNPAPVWVGHIQDPWEQRIRQFYKGTNVTVSNIVIE